MKTLLTLVLLSSLFFACTTDTAKDEHTAAATATDPSQTATGGLEAATVSPDKRNTLADIRIGMRDERVSAILGKPSKVDVITSEPGARMEDWWYGNNQKVRITGGEVTRIVPNERKEQEILVKIKEAKEKGDDAEVKRLMDEIGVSN